MNEDKTNGEQTPQGAESGSAPEITAIFAEVTSVEGESPATDEETYLPIEAYTGSRFIPNRDATRSVKVIAAPNGGAIVRLMRTGSHESNGCFMKLLDVASAFREASVSRYPAHTQVSFKLANGRLLTGYVALGKTRKGFYFPKNLAEAVLTLPPIGKRLPVKATMLIVG